MNKNEKENWTIDEFIKIYNKELNDDYKLIKKIPQNISPGPDFIILNSRGEKRGIEVTELLEYPSNYTGQQRFLEKTFKELFEFKIDKERFKHFYFVFHYVDYPSSREQLEQKVDNIVNKINKEYDDGRLPIQKGRTSKIAIGSQIVSVGLKDNSEDDPSSIFFSYGEEGVQDIDRQNFFKGLRMRIDEKNIACVRYDKNQPNYLLIYDNTKYSIFINNIKKEILDELGAITAKEFQEIWLLSGNRIFRLDS